MSGVLFNSLRNVSTRHTFETITGGAHSNAISIVNGNVGIGTTNPVAKFQINGNAIITGSLLDNNLNPLVGAIATWQTITPVPAFTIGNSGAASYSVQKGRYRGSGNEVVYNLEIGGTVTATPTVSSTDYIISLPYVYNASYSSNAILGELWLTVVNAGLSNVFKSFARALPSDNTKAYIRYLSGTTETAMGTLTSNVVFSLQGTLMYATATDTTLQAPIAPTLASISASSNVAPVLGSAFAWSAVSPAPTLSVSGYPGVYTPTSSAGYVRHIGQDVSYQVKLTGTVAGSIPNTSYYVLSLPRTLDLTTYTGTFDMIVGELWLKVTASGGAVVNTFKVFAKTVAGVATGVRLYILSGTAEDGFHSIAVGSTIQLYGTLNYESDQLYNGDIFTSYVPPALSQDFDNQVILNGSGTAPRAQLDVVGRTSLPALVVDAQGTNANSAIAQFRNNGEIMMTIGRDGTFYDGAQQATFIPGRSVQWAAATPPVVAGPVGSGTVLETWSSDARYKYGGNAVIYNFTHQFRVATAPTGGASAGNYTLTLPYALDTSKYNSNALGGTVLGDLWITTSNAAARLTFPGFARYVWGSANTVALRYLNGTTESTFADFASNLNVTVQGTLEYSSVQYSGSVTPSITSNIFYRDADGRVSVGTNAPPRGRLDIGDTSSVLPALVVDAQGSGDAVRIKSNGADAIVIDSKGNIGIGVSAPKGEIHVVGTSGNQFIIDGNANVGVGTTLPVASLHTSSALPLRVEQTVSGVEHPPLAASNVGYYADYTSPVTSIDTGTPLTLAEFPPVGLTSADTTVTGQTIALTGAVYGNGSYVLSANTSFSTTYPPWKAFNRTALNSVDCWISANGAFNASTGVIASGETTSVSGVNYTGARLQVQLPSPIVLKSYTLYSRITEASDAPTDWILAGSTNGSTWVLLDQQTSVGSWANNVPKLFLIASPGTTLYSYFRLIITKKLIGPSGTYTGISQFNLVADVPVTTTAREYPPLPMTANTTYLGGTYGAGTYIASASVTYTGLLPYYVFDKTSTDSLWASTGGVYGATTGNYTGTTTTYDNNKNKYSGEWLQIQSPMSIYVTTYSISCRVTGSYTSQSPSSWYILGSDDGISWTVLDSRTNISWNSGGQTQTFTMTSPQRATFHRMVTTKTNNTTASGLDVNIGKWKLFTNQTTYPKYRTPLLANATTYNPGTYSVYTNSMYNAFTIDAAVPVILNDKLGTTTAPWKTGGSNYTLAEDANPIPSVFFELPSAIRLKSYTFQAAGTTTAPSAWNLYGSNMAAAGGWLLLSAQTGVIYDWTLNLTQTYNVNTSAFDYFKIDFLRNCSAAGDYIGLLEVRFNADDASPESRMLVAADGRVGVNTPEAQLVANAAMTVSGNVAVTGNISSGTWGAVRNRIINGDMKLDQLYGGSNITVTGNTLVIDGWFVGNSTTSTVVASQVPAPKNSFGFTKALAVTITANPAALTGTQICQVEQRIELFNLLDLLWGDQNARPVAISFYVFTNQIGTYSLSIRNQSFTRSFVTSFNVAVANQWQRIERVVPGDYLGLWNANTSPGLYMTIALAASINFQTSDTDRWIDGSRALSGYGYTSVSTNTNFCGTLNNVFYLTGVQFEKGTIASQFEFRPYSAEWLLGCPPPSFSVSYNGSRPGNTNATGIVTYADHTTLTNGMNKSTGVFTCQRAGRYFFTFSAFSGVSVVGSVRYYKNGGAVGARNYGFSGSGNYATVSLSIVLDLIPNDTVDVRVIEGSLYFGDNCQFSGYMIA